MARRASPRGGARRLAPRRLGAGGGERNATPSASGERLSSAIWSEPACLNVLLDRVQLRSSALHRRAGPAGGVRRRSRVHVSAELVSQRHVTRRSLLHAHVPHPSERRAGATASRSRPATSSSPTRARMRNTARCWSPTRGARPHPARQPASTRRRCESSFAPAIRAGAGLFGNVLPAHALAGRNLTTIWRDRIDNPRTGRPIGSGPFLVGRWTAVASYVSSATRSYWGPHRAYLDRIVIRLSAERSRRGRLVPAMARSTLRPGFADAVPAFRRERGRERARRAERRRTRASPSGWPTGATRPLHEQARSPGHRVRHRSSGARQSRPGRDRP